MVLSLRKLIRRTTFLLLLILGSYLLHDLTANLREWTKVPPTNGDGTTVTAAFHADDKPAYGLSRLERLKLFYRLGE
ncbi:hypothetical protein [Gorillibacterium timonense]|uniref:hypothetical protein n=1 Tax=Gorillibacterium timonense TaxID=1689269 RepID=UPI00071C529F|nr:hypothetical protein [Gorillibacterium timonense]